MRLTVVGNGVAGSSVARAAREAGHSVRLISATEPSASLAALAVVRPGYVSREAQPLLRRSLALLRLSGATVLTGAVVSHPTRATKEEADWWAVDPGKPGHGFLLEADAAMEVPDAWEDPDSDYTIHATGERQPGAQITYGATWVNEEPDALTFTGLRVHRWAPYRSLDGVGYPTSSRLGSSTGINLLRADEQAVRLFAMAGEQGWLRRLTGWKLLMGVRASAPHIVHNGRLVRFGGFHKSGFSLAPALAERLIRELEITRLSREAALGDAITPEPADGTSPNAPMPPDLRA